jgi:SSS family solute:Na+ symporter
MASVYILLGIYALLLVIIAIITSRSTKNLNDFFLAGRNMGGWMTAFAYGTTYFSAVIMIGYAGQVGWSYGISGTWVGIGNAIIGSLVAWLVLAKRTRNITHALDASTMPEFFEKRYDSKTMKITAALLIFVFLVPYSASVYNGLSYLTETIIGVPFFWCMLGMAVLTGVYLVLGGYKATALSDFIQGIIMLGGIVAVILFVMLNPNVGGLSEGLKKLATVDPKLAGVVGPPGILNLLSFVLLTSLGTWGLPHIVHKFYAVRDEKAIRRGTIISTVFAVIFAGGAYFLGSFGRLFFADFTNVAVPLKATGAVNTDYIMPIVFKTALPEVLMGVVLVLVLSASMSTLSSLVLVSSSAISMDLVGGVLAPKMDKKKVNILMRIFCAVFVICSFLIAWGSSQAKTGVISVIVQLMSISWGTLAGAFLGPFLSGLWLRRAGKASAWAGMAVGFAVAMVLNLVPMKFGALTVTPLIAGSIAMFSSIIVSFVVTWLAPSKKAFDTSMRAPNGNGTAAA